MLQSLLPSAQDNNTDNTLSNQPNISDCLVQLLVDLGVRYAFGLVGGVIGPFCTALDRSIIRTVQCRHEAGAAFAATEAYFAEGQPTVVFTTNGPGITNALTGLATARWDGAKVILVSGSIAAAQRGRWAVQDFVHAESFLAVGAQDGGLFDLTARLEDARELPLIARRLATGLNRPQGLLAHISIPINIQTVKASLPAMTLDKRKQAVRCTKEVLAECLARLKNKKGILWVGYGARHATSNVQKLAAALGTPVMSTPRGKGIFPENHPMYLGVTGYGGHDQVEQYIKQNKPDYVLVLGSRLGEPSSCWSDEYIGKSGLIHVDMDASVFNTAYPMVNTLPILSDISLFIDDILEHIKHQPPQMPAPTPPFVEPHLTGTDFTPVRPKVLMQVIQKHVVEKTSARFIVDSGSCFAWAHHHLQFKTTHRYRVSGLWASMGHAACGVIGPSIATNNWCVALVGDAAMLMLQEISTAVQYQAPAIWIVLNDGQMGFVEKSMRLQNLKPFETQLPKTDFAALARSLGADGRRVANENELDAAFNEAFAKKRPFVLDIIINQDDMPPLMKRVRNLIAHGASESNK